MLSRGIRGNRVNEEDFELRFKVSRVAASATQYVDAKTGQFQRQCLTSL